MRKRLEYRAECRDGEDRPWHPVTDWSEEWPLKPGHDVNSPVERVVAKFGSEVWEVDPDSFDPDHQTGPLPFGNLVRGHGG